MVDKRALRSSVIEYLLRPMKEIEHMNIKEVLDFADGKFTVRKDFCIPDYFKGLRSPFAYVFLIMAYTIEVSCFIKVVEDKVCLDLEKMVVSERIDTLCRDMTHAEKNMGIIMEIIQSRNGREFLLASILCSEKVAMLDGKDFFDKIFKQLSNQKQGDCN